MDDPGELMAGDSGARGRIRAILEDAIASHAFPGAVVGVCLGTGQGDVVAAGRLTYEPGAPPVTAETVFDLASLTKVVATTPVVAKLVETGRLDLEVRVSALVEGFVRDGREEITLRHLLSHTSGLPAHVPFFREWTGRRHLAQRIAALPLERAPGERSVYSDVGFLLLGEVIDRVLREDFAAFVGQTVLDPLGMRTTTFRPPEDWQPRIAPTEVCPWRGRLLRGEVHDENACALGGVATHAGLFGTVGDLLRFGQMMLGGGSLDGVSILDRGVVQEFTKRCAVRGSTRALGWDTAGIPDLPRSSTPGEPGYSSAGKLLSLSSFGHTGFTGTSLWIDPERLLALVLLTNRVHPDRSNDAIRAVRAALADAVAELTDEPRTPAGPPPSGNTRS